MMSDYQIKLQKALMILHLRDRYYETDAAGGCVHIILDDGNYGQGFAQSCLDYSLEKDDFWGETISRLLLDFNEDEQEQILERSWEIYDMLNVS